jgi:hypothetical protein
VDHRVETQDRAHRVVGVAGAHDERYALKAIGLVIPNAPVVIEGLAKRQK